MAAALGAYFAYQLIAASRYPSEPALFPRIVGVAGVLLAAAIVARALMSPSAKTDALDVRRLWLAVAAPIVYAIGMWLLGYWIASAAALIVFPLLLGFRRPVLVVGTAVGIVVFFGVVLGYLDVRLPKGLLFS